MASSEERRESAVKEIKKVQMALERGNLSEKDQIHNGGAIERVVMDALSQAQVAEYQRAKADLLMEYANQIS